MVKEIDQVYILSFLTLMRINLRQGCFLHYGSGMKLVVYLQHSPLYIFHCFLVNFKDSIQYISTCAKISVVGKPS